MPSSIPHKKFCFYYLPTRRRAGIKLGDAWYVSNVSIIFDCSMLYYLLFWTLLGNIIHFYIIFWTNLLTGGPAQNCCFLPILEFRRKRISNGVQTEWNLQERDFRNKHDPEGLDPTSRNQRGSHKVGGHAYPLRRALHPRGPWVLEPRATGFPSWSFSPFAHQHYSMTTILWTSLCRPHDQLTTVYWAYPCFSLCSMPYLECCPKLGSSETTPRYCFQSPAEGMWTI